MHFHSLILINNYFHSLILINNKTKVWDGEGMSNNLRDLSQVNSVAQWFTNFSVYHNIQRVLKHKISSLNHCLISKIIF